MITLQYVISSILFIIPFIVAGIIEATFDKLFLKTGRVLDLTNLGPNGVAGDYQFLSSSGSNSVFKVEDTSTGKTYLLIGTNNPYVFYGADAGIANPTEKDYLKNRLEVKFTSDKKCNITFTQISSETTLIPEAKDFIVQTRVFKDSDSTYLLYRYNYGQWLAVALVGVFGLTIFRILNKELTIANIVQATKKFRVGLFGFDTSLEEGKGYTVLKAIKFLLNFLGWIVSFFVFPTSNLMFYISFIVILLTFYVSLITFAGTFRNKLDSTWNTILGVSFIAILFLFSGVRFLSDRNDPEKTVLSQ